MNFWLQAVPELACLNIVKMMTRHKKQNQFLKGNGHIIMSILYGNQRFNVSMSIVVFYPQSPSASLKVDLK